MEQRNNLQNMMKSIIDFVFMMKSNLIIGSYGSSFSDETIFLNNIVKLIPLGDSLRNKLITNNISYHCLGFNFIKQNSFATLSIDNKINSNITNYKVNNNVNNNNNYSKNDTVIKSIKNRTKRK